MPIFQHSALDGLDLHEGKRHKEPVRAASTANVNIASPGTTLDGVTLVSGDRVLLKNQTTGSQNGIYVWTGAAAALTRSLDADTAADFTYGFLVYVREGTANATSYWKFDTTTAITIGTTSLTFTAIGAGALSDPTTTRGDLIVRGASAIVRFAIGTVGKFLGTDGTDPVWTNSAQYFGATGLTGATAGGRFVGATASGAPASGTFAVGDLIIDQTGKVWVCTGAGTPGTWAQSGGGMSNPMTANQDVIVGGTSPAGTPTRIGVGANGQVLTVTAGAVGWANSASGFSNPMTTIGDIITGATAGAAQRTAIGANGQLLTVVGGVPAWANAGAGSPNQVSASLYLARTCI
jgi:hypothetical protein